jgi:hypothetical protein
MWIRTASALSIIFFLYPLKLYASPGTNPSPGTWVAVAISREGPPERSSVQYAAGFGSSQPEATDSALRTCRSGPSSACSTIGASNACVAVAIDRRLTPYAEFDPAQGNVLVAKRNALRDCATLSPLASSCHLWFTACPDRNVTVAGPADLAALAAQEIPGHPELVSLQGEKFDRSVDLSAQFPNPVRRQSGGLCFAHSSAALIESFCHEHGYPGVSVSKTYLYYQNLAYNLSKYSKAPVLASALKADARGWIIEGFDGGWAENVLNRVKNHAVVSESESPSDEALIETIRRLRDSHPSATDLRPLLLAAANDLVKSDFEKFQISTHINSDGAIDAFTRQDALASCLKIPISVKREDFSYERALDILDHERRPFECTYAGHSIVVEGYRIDPDHGQVEFKTRDSAKAAEPWVAHPCDSIVTIRD